MQLVLTIIIFALVFTFGTAIASFLNVLVYRIPRRLDFIRGRSFCPSCAHALSGFDLVPIFSYLALGRRCRYCHEPIGVRYLLVELVGGVLALLSWLAFLGVSGGTAQLLAREAGPTLLAANPWLAGASAPAWAALVTFAVLCVLMTITLIDADTMEIPDGLNIALAVLALLSLLCGPEVALLSRGIGIVAVSLPLFIIAFALPGAFGGGDIKLMAAAGFLLGWQQVLVAFFIGLLIGGGYGIFALLSKRKGPKDHFAFGPALCVGIATVLFLGRALISWYLALL
jgi:leader peptidase (prepilin peptidase)/N-methyltransferase